LTNPFCHSEEQGMTKGIRQKQLETNSTLAL
jgi:hypothetical protein